MPRITDAEFSVVSEVRPRRRPWYARAGLWLCGLAVQTIFGTVVAFVAAMFVLFVLRVPTGRAFGWAVTPAMLVVGWLARWLLGLVGRLLLRQKQVV